LLDLYDGRDAVKSGVVTVSLSGATGTGAAYGPKAAELRETLAKELRLGNRDSSWHSARHGIAGLSAWATQISASLAKMGEDVLLMTQSGIGELHLSGGGSSSTMPQKQNPVLPSVLSALARGVIGANTVLQGAVIHRQQRDAAAWMSEWMALGQVCMGAGRGLAVAEEMLQNLNPDAAAMRRNIDDGRGLIYAEALQFALTDRMSRPDAQAAVKELCQTIVTDGGSLKDAALAKWDTPKLAALFTPEAQLGLAPSEAYSFAAKARV
jgi:3-carboxy-cis,cis-muconate cycloisomerase